MPAAQCGAALVPGERAGDVQSGQAARGAAQTELDIFQIGFESAFQQADAAEKFGTQEHGGKRRRPDPPLDGKDGAVSPAAADAPGGTPSAERIECAVDLVLRSGSQDFAGGEPCGARFGGGGETREVIGGQFDVAVEYGHPTAAAFADTAVDGFGEAGVTAHREDAGAAGARGIGSAVGRAIVHHQPFGGGQRLGLQSVEQPFQQGPAVPDRHDGGDAHRKNRFLTRKARFWMPSRQGLSFISPRRVEYRIAISPKRMRRLRIASILISSEKAMPSASSFMSCRMERRKTHMPDWESRTQRKKRMEVASESTTGSILAKACWPNTQASPPKNCLTFEMALSTNFQPSMVKAPGTSRLLITYAAEPLK